MTRTFPLMRSPRAPAHRPAIAPRHGQRRRPCSSAWTASRSQRSRSPSHSFSELGSCSMRANQSGRKASNSGNGSVATRSISRSGSQNALMPSTAPMASCSASGQASTGVAAYQVLGTGQRSRARGQSVLRRPTRADRDRSPPGERRQEGLVDRPRCRIVASEKRLDPLAKVVIALLGLGRLSRCGALFPVNDSENSRFLPVFLHHVRKVLMLAPGRP